MDPGYWARQMRQPVRFAAGVEALLSEGCGLLLEVGPGQDLTALVRANVGGERGKVKALPSLRRQGSSASEHAVLLQALGDAWAQGLPVDWKAFYARERRLRLSLPTYPFQEKRCWVEAVPGAAPARPATALPRATAATAATPALASPDAAPAAAPAVAPASGREDMPRGDIEERVAALWRARLGVEHVGRDDELPRAGRQLADGRADAHPDARHLRGPPPPGGPLRQPHRRRHRRAASRPCCSPHRSSSRPSRRP